LRRKRPRWSPCRCCISTEQRAPRASWKYLLVGGTGIALSLLGSFCLGYASLVGNGHGDLTFTSLVAQGASLSRPWLITAWVLLLAGYGTKMGLAPMHTWKPDAYGEAPGMVGALLAGAPRRWHSSPSCALNKLSMPPALAR